MNKITVHGNLTGKPELRHSRSGVPVATFTIAANRRRLNRQRSRLMKLDRDVSRRSSKRT